MLNIKRIDRVSNAKIYDLTQTAPLVENVRTRQLRFLGHVIRMQVDNAMVSLTVSTYVHDWTQPQNFASKLFSQLWQKWFKGHFSQKCMGEKAILVRITNSTRIACCSKMTYKCFVIFSAEPLYFRLWLLLIPFSIANNPRTVHGSNSSLLQL